MNKQEACEICTDYYSTDELSVLKTSGGYVCKGCIVNSTEVVGCCEGCGLHFLFEEHPRAITDGFIDICSSECLIKHKMAICKKCSMIDYRTEMKSVAGVPMCTKCLAGEKTEVNKNKLEIQITKNLKEYSISNPDYVKRTMSAIVRLNASVVRNCNLTIAGYPNSAMKIVINKKETVIVTPVEVIYIVDTVPTTVYSARSGDTLDNLQSLVNKYKSLEFILYIFDGRKDINKLIEYAKSKK